MGDPFFLVKNKIFFIVAELHVDIVHSYIEQYIFLKYFLSRMGEKHQLAMPVVIRTW